MDNISSLIFQDYETIRSFLYLPIDIPSFYV